MNYCYFCFQPADKQWGKYNLCVPCLYKFEDAIDGLVAEILERGAFKAKLIEDCIPLDDAAEAAASQR